VRRVFVFAFAVVFSLVSTVGARMAHADGAPTACTAQRGRLVAASPVVWVDAYEHGGFGVLVGDRRHAVTSLRIVDVDRPGAVHVRDARGARHDAFVTAVDPLAGIALLALEDAIDPAAPVPTAQSASEPSGGRCFLYLDDAADPDRAPLRWSERATARRPPEVLVPGAPLDEGRRPAPDAEGSPVLDADGVLVGVLVARAPGGLADARAVDALFARRPNAPEARRPLIPYAGLAVDVETARAGRTWGGFQLAVGTRYRDLLELRVDAAALIFGPSDDCNCHAEGPNAPRASASRPGSPSVRSCGSRPDRSSTRGSCVRRSATRFGSRRSRAPRTSRTSIAARRGSRARSLPASLST
jgi:hypothetical protein